MITQPQSAPALSSASTRFHALDATRGLALLIGIGFHSLESLISLKAYSIVQDTQGSLLIDAAYYVCHVFRMQVFFLIAGFFAHLLYHLRGRRAFIVNRVQRLVLPFVLFLPVNYVLITSLWVWKICRESGVPWQQAFAQLPPEYRFEAGAVPMIHLWFLYFLILFCAGVVVTRPALDRWVDPTGKLRSAADRFLTLVTGRWWGALALALLTLAPMLQMTKWFGVDTPGPDLWPYWPSFVVYGTYFTLGWFLHRQTHLLTNLQKFKGIHLSVGLLCIGTLLVLKLLYDPTDPAISKPLLRTMNFVYTFASMTTALAFVGYMLAYFSAPNPRVRYISDAAYSSYLIHFPVVVFFQIIVAPYPWHWLVKVVLILGPTLLILLLTYQFGVRNTWIGLLLNGRKYQ